MLYFSALNGLARPATDGLSAAVVGQHGRRHMCHRMFPMSKVLGALGQET